MVSNSLKHKAVIITPTTGSDYLLECHQSVLSQDYPNIEHLVVVDGEKFYKKTKKILKNYSPKLCLLPYNTGSNGFYGHRIYASFPHLVDCDYVFFLDEDNWLEPNHVKSCVETMQSSNVDWCFSLRNLYEKNGLYIAQDNCESLGPWSKYNLVDTSAYSFGIDFIRKNCFAWDYGWGADRRFFAYVMKSNQKTSFATTGQYTLNYRLGGNDGSVKKEFFVKGNEENYNKYNGNYPWAKKLNQQI